MNEKKILLLMAAAALGAAGTAFLLGGGAAEKRQGPPNEKNPEAERAALSPKPGDRIKGADGAAVTLLEFSDLQCPYCKRFHPTMLKIMDDYKGKIRWIYRHFPLKFHQNARSAAEAAECAGEQGKFWEYIEKTFENSRADGTGLEKEDLEKYSEELGLDSGRFKKCFSARKFAGKIDADIASGKAAGVTGTPATLLIGPDGKAKMISGAVPYAKLKAEIDAALETE